MTDNERMLLEVAARLPENLLRQVVFLGGAVAGSLLTDSGVGEVRSTQDVDLVVGITSKTEFHRFEEDLRTAGFFPVMDEDAPICRWRIGSVLTDIMPCSADILGFTNKWYPAAVKNASSVVIGDKEIRMVTAPYFLATKMEAFLGRGNNDFLGSPDMEDIVTLIDGREELIEEVKHSSKDLQAYLKNIVQKWLEQKSFLNCISGHLISGPTSNERQEEVLKRIQRIAARERRA